MRVTPFDTGKVKIGCNWEPQPKPPHMSHTETMLQNALLRGPRQIDWSGVRIIAGSIGIVVLAYVVGWLSI